MKCRTSKCSACCCYNVPFEKNELERFHDRVVTPIIYSIPLGMARLPFTDNDLMKNKCPFLRKDLKCNIYDNRPEVCRLMGTIDRMPCKWLKR